MTIGQPSSTELVPAFAAAKDICRRHARSFYFASFFLPPAKRAAAYAVYAFCRLMDDAVDERGGDESAESFSARFDALGQRLDQIYDGRLDLPPIAQRTESDHALLAFAKTVGRYEVPRQYFLDLSEGCRMDLTISRYATWADLERYCYHVAGVVGLIMCRVFELKDSDCEKRAVQMGNAMQLTNILRDVKEDGDRGRIYLPAEDLRRFGYDESDLLSGVVNEPFRAMMRFEIDRARRMYYEGAEGLSRLPNDGSRLTASAMGTIYGGILGAIERWNYNVFSGRARLTTFQKLCRIPAARRLARRGPGEPVPRVFG